MLKYTHTGGPGSAHKVRVSILHSLLSFATSNYVLEEDLQGCGLLSSTSSQVLKLQSADLY